MKRLLETNRGKMPQHPDYIGSIRCPIR